MSVYDLPMVNAVLNLIATIFLIRGFFLIKAGKKEEHRKSMLTAFTFSALFLICYLVYHYQVGSVPFTGEGIVRTVYFIILVPHIILAAVMTPFIVFLLFFALTEKFERHKKLARWVWPVWVYVSITGVMVYLMNYVIWPSTAIVR